eukprot:2174245-Pyramimonas_sp.AAC.1
MGVAAHPCSTLYTDPAVPYNDLAAAPKEAETSHGVRCDSAPRWPIEASMRLRDRKVREGVVRLTSGFAQADLEIRFDGCSPLGSSACPYTSLC